MSPFPKAEDILPKQNDMQSRSLCGLIKPLCPVLSRRRRASALVTGGKSIIKFGNVIFWFLMGLDCVIWYTYVIFNLEHLPIYLFGLESD